MFGILIVRVSPHTGRVFVCYFSCIACRALGVGSMTPQKIQHAMDKWPKHWKNRNARHAPFEKLLNIDMLRYCTL